jgi:hypothetical protein
MKSGKRKFKPGKVPIKGPGKIVITGNPNKATVKPASLRRSEVLSTLYRHGIGLDKAGQLTRWEPSQRRRIWIRTAVKWGKSAAVKKAAPSPAMMGRLIARALDNAGARGLLKSASDQDRMFRVIKAIRKAAQWHAGGG